MITLRIFPLLLMSAGIGICGENPDASVPRMPPRGISIPIEVRTGLETGVAALGKEIEGLRTALKSKPELLELLPDAQIYYNAVRYALEDDVFYKTNDFAGAKKLLAEGIERARLLREGQAPWNTATGLIVRGYVSKIDGSVQPYGLVVPPAYHANATHSYRLDFWYHGRGVSLTELSFITDREKNPGEFTPADTFVLHPYGRYCNANKFAGEVDSFEALENARKHYPIDENRVSVRGFSMGGAATWHMATHHAGLWAVAAPGAGFVDTAVFQKIFEKGPPPTWYEVKLWHLYDSKDYAGNLFNCGVVAYSGEIDGQKQAADLMAKAMAAEGLELVHIIGPKTGHKYEPKAKEEVAQRVDVLANAGRNPMPKQIKFTTWTLRYNQMDWVTVDGLEHHWERARVNAEILGDNKITVNTTNVSALTLAMPKGLCPLADAHKPVVLLDGQELEAPVIAPDHSWTAHFRKSGTQWKSVKSTEEGGLRKTHGLQGPIDDAFMDSFIMVRPTGKPLNEKIGAWTINDMTNAVAQWRLQFRGEARVKDDSAITAEEIASSNLILWGDPQSNQLLARIAKKLPLHWDAKVLRVSSITYPADEHVPVMIFPNPLNPKHYVVLNTGFTFSTEAHTSNALQIAKLPDYAVIDINVPLAARVPKGVVEAGFFDEHWGPAISK